MRIKSEWDFPCQESSEPLLVQLVRHRFGRLVITNERNFGWKEREGFTATGVTTESASQALHGQTLNRCRILIGRYDTPSCIRSNVRVATRCNTPVTSTKQFEAEETNDTHSYCVKEGIVGSVRPEHTGIIRNSLIDQRRTMTPRNFYRIGN